MAEVKWIKLSTDIFSNRKIVQIESMPEGDALIVIWLKLLILAGETNADGMVWFTSTIPYTEQMLATAFGRPMSTIQLALKTFSAFGMIEIVDDFIRIPNWEKYQNVEGLERVREQTRKRVAEYRERKKALPEIGVSNNDTKRNVTSNVTVTQGNAIDIDKEIDKDKEDIVSCNSSSYDSELQLTRRTDVRRIVDKWNEIGVSPIKEFTTETNRAKMLFTRIREHGIENVLQAIDNVKQSDFLKGQNGRGWVVTFDWFVKPNNFQKVLEGNYNPSKAGQKFYGEKRGTSTSNMILDMIKNGEFDE